MEYHNWHKNNTTVKLCNYLNLELSNSQLVKLKSAVKIEVKLLLTDTQISRLHKAVENNFLANIKLTKTQSH